MQHTQRISGLTIALALLATPAWAQLGTQLPAPADWNQRQQRNSPSSQRPLPVPGMAAPVGQGSVLPPAPGVILNPDQSYRVLVMTLSPVQMELLRQTVPQAFPVRYQGQVVMQAGVFASASEAEQLAERLRQQGLLAQVVSPVQQQVAAAQREARMQMVLTPPHSDDTSALASIAHWQQLRHQALPSSTRQPTVRVLVRPATPTQKEEMLKLLPEAFRSSYRGQIFWQVGRFQDQVRAEQLVQYLRSRGFHVVVESQ
jgi:cell division septation protein DedD